ncbi:MAG: hypothetical protein ACKOSS_02050 [Planctomycetia bacterium]
MTPVGGLAWEVAMEPTGNAVFRFSGEGAHLEFAGSEEFVAQQLERFQSIIQRAIGQAPQAAAGSAGAGAGSSQGRESASREATGRATATGETPDAWVAARPVRGGRGAIQDRIVLFIGYLQMAQGKHEVNSTDIVWCFRQLGLEVPKNLSNTLGLLKRKIKFLTEGSRRGYYSLSADGRKFVQSL